MFLTHCVMEWTVLTVLSLCLPVWSAVKVFQPYAVVTTDGTAQIECFIQPQPTFHHTQPSSDQKSRYPYPDPERLRVSLLKGLYGTQELCSSTLNIPEQIHTDVKTQGQVQCSAELREGAVKVTVSGLKATDTDMYRCGIETLYPPPYLLLTGNGTLVHVLDSSVCPVQGPEAVIAHHDDDEEEDGGSEERTAPVNIPVVVVVTLVIIVLIIIIYFQILQHKTGKREIIRSVPGGPYKVDAVAFSYDNSV